MKAFKWVLCSFRPLALEALIQAIAMNVDGSVDHVIDESFVLQLCTNFIVVTKSGIVRFAHRSVKEYILHSHALAGSSYKISLVTAHAEIRILVSRF